MKLYRLWQLLGFAIAALAFTIAGCTSKPRLVNHSFQFNAMMDSNNVEILDWRYGTSKSPGARPDDYMLRGWVPKQSGFSGLMPVGDDLYVKWLVLSTLQIHEETVNLKAVLPRDITNHWITLIIKNETLYVYLIPQKESDPKRCPSRERTNIFRLSHEPDERIFGIYCSRKIIRLHPVYGVVPIFK